MFLVALFVTTVVLHQVLGADTNYDKAAGGTQTNRDITAVSTVEAKDIGGGYGFEDGYSRQVLGAKSYNGGYGGFVNRGYGGNNHHHGGQYGGGHHGGNYGGHHGGQHGGHQGNHHNGHKIVPIKIPYIDGNGCRFPGDVVCNVGGAITTYSRCVLLNENKNLWKKPSMTIVDITCDTGTQTVTTFCNDNERILKAAGLIQQKDEDSAKHFHLGKYSVQLDPCIHTA